LGEKKGSPLSARSLSPQRRNPQGRGDSFVFGGEQVFLKRVRREITEFGKEGRKRRDEKLGE